jgi:hypothetical protein
LPRACAGSVRREPVVERKECLNCSIRVLTSPLPRRSARGDVLYDMCYNCICYTLYVTCYMSVIPERYARAEAEAPLAK